MAIVPAASAAAVLAAMRAAPRGRRAPSRSAASSPTTRPWSRCAPSSARSGSWTCWSGSSCPASARRLTPARGRRHSSGPACANVTGDEPAVVGRVESARAGPMLQGAASATVPQSPEACSIRSRRWRHLEGNHVGSERPIGPVCDRQSRLLGGSDECDVGSRATSRESRAPRHRQTRKLREGNAAREAAVRDRDPFDRIAEIGHGRQDGRLFGGTSARHRRAVRRGVVQARQGNRAVRSWQRCGRGRRVGRRGRWRLSRRTGGRSWTRTSTKSE